jgi:hypothetical protein
MKIKISEKIGDIEVMIRTEHCRDLGVDGSFI